MKKIEAIIQLSKLNEVQEALAEIGIDAMTVCEVRGFGRQNQHTETYRAKEYTIKFRTMIKIDLVVDDSLLEPAVQVIVQSAKSDANSHGRILVSDVREAAFAVEVGSAT